RAETRLPVQVRESFQKIRSLIRFLTADCADEHGFRSTSNLRPQTSNIRGPVCTWRVTGCNFSFCRDHKASGTMFELTNIRIADKAGECFNTANELRMAVLARRTFS